MMDGVKRCDLAASGVIETIHYRFHNSKFPARTSMAATMQSGRRSGGGSTRNVLTSLPNICFHNMSTATFRPINHFNLRCRR